MEVGEIPRLTERLYELYTKVQEMLALRILAITFILDFHCHFTQF